MPNIIFIIAILVTLIVPICCYDSPVRNKRFLVFPRGGIFKIVIGIINPLKLGSKQSMGIGWNFQFQYAAPTNASQLVSYPPIYTGTGKRSVEVILKNDRALFYKLLEDALNSEDLNGQQCLLRSICENALDSLTNEANGLYGQIFHIILTPNFGDGEIDDELDPIYLEAQSAGEYGVECESLYTECKLEYGLLDLFSTIVPQFG